jgi:uncharacterized iron-regulated protein
MKTGKKSKQTQNKISEEELAERYVASLLLLSGEFDISPEKAHEGVTELLQELEENGQKIDVSLDDINVVETKH